MDVNELTSSTNGQKYQVSRVRRSPPNPLLNDVYRYRDTLSEHISHENYESHVNWRHYTPKEVSHPIPPKDQLARNTEGNVYRYKFQDKDEHLSAKHDLDPGKVVSRAQIKIGEGNYH